MKILFPAAAALGMAGCGEEMQATAPSGEVPRPGAMPYVFGGRYQGVASNNQFAVWVVDTQTGAVTRCDMQACGEWVLPKALAWAPAPSAHPVGQREPGVPGLSSQK